MDPDRQFPSVEALRRRAQRRIPRFALDYLEGGIGRNSALRRNYSALDRVLFRPRYLSDHADKPLTNAQFLGKGFAAPFGVAPIGLSGLIWPRASEYLARAAAAHEIPFALSGFSTSSLESLAGLGNGQRWYQHYVCCDEAINEALLERANATGFEVLVLTVDIPTATRRDHDIKNGVSVPPHFDLKTVLHAMVCPAWCLHTLRAGIPQFENLRPYMPKGMSLKQSATFLTDLIEGHVCVEKLRWYRRHWAGQILVKGIMDPEEARLCLDEGIDGIVVSNHGGRQLDGCQSAIEVLPEIRQVVGPDFPLVADGGIRNGLDIARYIARGADLVLLGRAFMYSVAALGRSGPEHLMDILKQEYRIALAQIGCATGCELRQVVLD